MAGMTGAAAKILANQLLDDGFFYIRSHCKRRMEERNLSFDDIDNAIHSGEFQKEAEWDEWEQEWRYKIIGFDVEGDELSVVFAFEGSRLVIIVTAY